MFRSDRLLALALGLALTLGATASRAAPPVIVDTAGVEAALGRGAIVWDVRPDEDYRRSHIPGSVNMDDILLQLRDQKSEDYLPVPRLAALLGEAGIDPAREIVVYGPKAATSAYFGLATLQWLGATSASVYHGGIDDWKAAGKAVETEPTRLPALSLTLQPRDEMLVSTRDVIARLNRPDVQIIDARTAREFAGDDIRALRGGHIPGAVNIPYETNWVDPDTPRKLVRRQVSNKDGLDLKPADQLAALYAGLDPSKETIVYCQSGVRASNTLAVLQTLGFSNVKVYDASWLGYGNTLDAPADSVSYFNVGRVNSLLNALQSRVEDLEDRLGRLKKATGCQEC